MSKRLAAESVIGFFCGVVLALAVWLDVVNRQLKRGTLRGLG